MDFTKRSVTIHITNATTLFLYRHFHHLSHGHWRKVPPEAIAPGHPAQLVAVPIFAHRGIYGKLQYSFVISNVEHIIALEFKVSVVTGHACFKGFLAAVARSVKLPQISDLINCEWKQTSGEKSRITYYVVILETPLGKTFFQNCRTNLRDTARQLEAELNQYNCSLQSRPSYLMVSQIETRIPRHFLQNTKNKGWRVRLRSTSFGSLYLRITNLTRETLSIADPVENDDRSSSAGRWIEFPRTSIPPGCCSEAGLQCAGFFSTCRGSVTYGNGSPNSRQSLTFCWEYGTRICRAFAQKLSWSRLSVVKYTESGREGSIYFYVLDPYDLPRLELLVVRVVDREAVDEEVARLSQSSKPATALRQAVSKYSSTPITTDFIRFLRENKAGKNVEPLDAAPDSHSRYACTEFSLFSAQMFLSSAQTSIAPPTALSELIASQRFGLYLEWQIGCEYFCRLWLPEERVWLYTGFPGATAAVDVLFGSEVFHQEAVPPSELLDLHPATRLSTYSVESDYQTPLTTPLSREDLLNRVVQAMQHLSSGLHSVVVSCMNSTYGRYWLTKECPIPRAHVWKEKEDSELLLDLEGVIFVIVSRWDEVFESVFHDAGLSFADVKCIQRPCVCWSSQELYHFTESSVTEFLQHAHKVLTALKQPAIAADIDKLYRPFAQSIYRS